MLFENFVLNIHERKKMLTLIALIHCIFFNKSCCTNKKNLSFFNESTIFFRNEINHKKRSLPSTLIWVKLELLVIKSSSTILISTALVPPLLLSLVVLLNLFIFDWTLLKWWPTAAAVRVGLQAAAFAVDVVVGIGILLARPLLPYLPLGSIFFLAWLWFRLLDLVRLLSLAVGSDFFLVELTVSFRLKSRDFSLHFLKLVFFWPACFAFFSSRFVRWIWLSSSWLEVFLVSSLVSRMSNVRSLMAMGRNVLLELYGIWVLKLPLLLLPLFSFSNNKLRCWFRIDCELEIRYWTDCCLTLVSFTFSMGANRPWLVLHWKYLM